jgi:hypothetical protein
MYGMMGLTSGWMDDELCDETEEEVERRLFNEDRVCQNDIVEIAVRNRHPVLSSSKRYDSKVQLRILGEIRGSNHIHYLALITEYDAEKIDSTMSVDRYLQLNYDIEDRFLESKAIEISELHVRNLIKKQNGRFCEVCTDYNPDVRLPKEMNYRCPACRLNPYR